MHVLNGMNHTERGNVQNTELKGLPVGAPNPKYYNTTQRPSLITDPRINRSYVLYDSSESDPLPVFRPIFPKCTSISLTLPYPKLYHRRWGQVQQMETRNPVQASILSRGASAIAPPQEILLLHSFPPIDNEIETVKERKKKGKEGPESPSRCKPIAASQDYRFRKNRQCRDLSKDFFFSTSNTIPHNPLCYF